VLSVLLQFTDSDYPFGIFKLFSKHDMNLVIYIVILNPQIDSVNDLNHGIGFKLSMIIKNISFLKSFLICNHYMTTNRKQLSEI
jgi:hypothetical protein